MAYAKTVFRIILSSPSDLDKERETVKRIIDEINETYKTAPIALQLFMWETDVSPLTNMRPGQFRIDELFKIDDSDVLIGMFNKRIGSPVLGASSGTDHEIEIAIKSYINHGTPNIMLYFKKNKTIIEDLSEKDVANFQELQRRKREYMKLGIVQEYSSLKQFEQFIRKHITQFFDEKYNAQQNKKDEQRVVLKGRKDFERMEEIVSSATEEVYILGINLEGAMNIRELLIKKALSGVKIRLLALDPKGDAIGPFNINDVDLQVRRNKIISNLQLMRDLSTYSNIQIKVVDRFFIAGCTAVDFNNQNGRIIAQHYLTATSTSVAPTLDLNYKDSPYWMGVYSNYLESLWNKYAKEYYSNE